MTFGGRHLDQGENVSMERQPFRFVNVATYRAQLREAQIVARTFADRLQHLQDRYEALENAASAAWVDLPSEYAQAQYQTELEHLAARIAIERENVSWSLGKMKEVCEAFRKHVESSRTAY